MKKTLFKEIEIPEGVEAKIEDSIFIVKGPEGENQRRFEIRNLDFKIEKGKIVVGHKKAAKTEKKLMNTIAAHIVNMIAGVQKKFEYQLKICSGHFPMTLKIEGRKAIIKNFLGEKIERSCSIPEKAEVDIQGNQIIIKSLDKEVAGQAAANFEKATKIRNRDKRVFQDGIYIINKAGREI